MENQNDPQMQAQEESEWRTGQAQGLRRRTRRHLRRAMIKADVQLPTTYSPTIMPPTFSLFLQLATISKFKMATMDIKSAYLNEPLPDEADWIITTLEPHIAEVCGLDPAQQEYRIANALYGLPDSGRIFYPHYKAALTIRQLHLLQDLRSQNNVHHRIR
jgi:hypothetical protein